MRRTVGTVYMSKKTGFQGTSECKTLGPTSVLGQKKTSGAIKVTSGQLGKFQILDGKKKYDDIMNKYIKKDNEMPINRNEFLPEQKLDLKKFSTAQALNNNQLKNISTDKVNNPQKSPNIHYSIESKDKKNQKFKDTKKTQIIASQQKTNNPVSDLNLGNKQKSEFLLQNKTKPLKQRGSTAHQIKKKQIIIDGSIQTPLENQNPLEKSEVLNSSQKKNIMEFNISESPNDSAQTKKMNQTDSHFIKYDDNNNIRINNNFILQKNNNEINNYIKQIENLKKELNDEKAKNKILFDENNILKNKITQLNNEINKIQGLKNQIKTLENDLAKKNIEIQNKLSQNIKRPYEITSIKPGEKILSVNFVSMGTQDIANYSLVCKNVDLFVSLEERLFEEFPQFKKYDAYYQVNTYRMKRYLTLEENKIKNNDIINIFFIEE